MDIDALIEAAKQKRRSGEVTPILVVEGDSTVHVALKKVWGDQEVRAQLMFSLGGTLGYGLNAKRAIVVVDAWCSETDATAMTEAEREEYRSTEHAGEVLLPRDDPNRTEALLVSESTRDTLKLTTIKYTNVDGVITFMEPDVSTDFEDFTFKRFWEGVAAAEAQINELAKALLSKGLAHTFKDTGRTALDGARVAARQVAFEAFGEWLTVQ